ncbi:hypothetical protein ABEF93_003919 [Exophiala dermatitidis]
MGSPHEDQSDRARKHVDAIRKEAGLDNGQDSSRNVQNLENALHTLADELYHKSTHFLLELIQNADDNEYLVAEPEITLTYKDRRLRIDCNERGFSPQNVEAICRVGSSTKAGQDRASSYVGEKGIGFKSVFKAADIVWISSNSYTFKFDKRNVLGMIAPIWEAFPEPTDPSWTSMLLQLSPGYEEKQLLHDLKTFDPRMLIFLRRLKKVKIVIHRAGPVWQTTLTKKLQRNDQETAIELTQDHKTLRYMVSSYLAENLPAEPKRPGARSSQIMLAFPDCNGAEAIESQKVYAFLPVRDYGFKFLLQADFLLSANREEILAYPQWNQALRQAFVDAFVAVTKEYCQGRISHLWPQYIPLRPSQTRFFESARKEILERLSREPVLRCRTNELMTPCSLLDVPDEFCDKEGVPMTSTPTSDRAYLSCVYPTSLTENLEVLGVRKMTASIFLDHLASFITQHSELFREQKPDVWHTRLAEILLKLSFDSANHDRIAELPVIPLSDGRWVSAKEDYVFLPQEAESCRPPEGFRLSLVREGAANNPTTRSLYLQLGLMVLGKESIAYGIIREHMKESFNPHAMTVAQLISQAAFLFHARVDDYRVKKFWFATGLGSARFHGDEVYLHSDKPFAASHYFTGRPEIPFLQSDYENVGGEDGARWYEWLEHVAGLSTLPRLAEPIPKQPTSLRLSSHFKFIIRYNEPKDFLILLRDNWNHYSQWLEDDRDCVGSGIDEPCRKRLRNELGQSQIRCHGGIMKPLRDVFLSIPELVEKAQGQVPFVEVDDALDPRWRRLAVLGLGVEGDVRFYLRCLESMSGSREQTAVDRAALLLEQIQARYADDEELVRNSFAKKPLICIPSSTPTRWAKVGDCLWGGPACLRLFVPLKNIYPSCQRLFRDFFLVPDATVSDVVREVKFMNLGDPLTYILSLFLQLEKHLEQDEISTAVDSLLTHAIWPIYTTKDAGDWDFLGCAKSSTPWFIADRAHLLDSFQGIVPLLAFGVEDVLKMPLLIQKLGAERRKLTRAVISIAENVDVAYPNLTLQEDLRSRAELIARLIPQKERGKKEKIDKLKALQVFSTPKVVQSWAVNVGTDTLPGRSSDGSVVLSTQHETLKIFITENYFEENKTPADLVEALARFCTIDDRQSLLLTITLTENLQKIHEWFQRHGVPLLNLDNDVPDEVEDADDFDPRKQERTPTRSKYRTIILKQDIVRMFLPVGPMKEVGLGGTPVIHHGPDSTLGFPAAEKASVLKGEDLYFDYHDDGASDAKSVRSDAGSTWSGTTIGSGSTIRGDEKKGNSLSASARIRSRFFRKAPLPPKDDAFKLEYAGQSKVSQELSRMLGTAYDPNTHWTSPLRTRDGYKPFVTILNSEGKAKIYASFTLEDTSKLFTRYLAQNYPEAAKWVIKPPVYHLDVKTTTGGLNSEFSLSNAQVKMARTYSISTGEGTGIPANVYFLVRVFHVGEKASIQFIMDPWSHYLTDKLCLRAEKEYIGRVQGEVG